MAALEMDITCSSIPTKI